MVTAPKPPSPRFAREQRQLELPRAVVAERPRFDVRAIHLLAVVTLDRGVTDHYARLDRAAPGARGAPQERPERDAEAHDRYFGAFFAAFFGALRGAVFAGAFFPAFFADAFFTILGSAWGACVTLP
jgi:hypothetical protein